MTLKRYPNGALAAFFYEKDAPAAVSAGMSQGKSRDKLRQTILLKKYKDWAQYARLRVKNIEAASKTSDSTGDRITL